MTSSAARNLCLGLLNHGRVFLQSSISSSKVKSLLLRTTNFAARLNRNKLRFYSQDSNQWVTITFEKHDGTQLKRKGKVDETIQEVIGQNNPDFPGYGACDGTISCSTCHVILQQTIFNQVDKATDEEIDTMDLSPCLTETSRLGCCITLTSDMDGMIVKLPEQVRDLRDRH